MKNKLISMVDFVLSKSNLWVKDESKYSDLNFIKSVCRYAEFLSLPLKLGFFIPCDENGVPIVEPNSDNYISNEYPTGENGKYWSDLEQYQQARDRVLFEGFELVKEYENAWTFRKDGLDYEFNIFKDCTIEELQQNFLGDEITLTASAIKQFEL